MISRCDIFGVGSVLCVVGLILTLDVVITAGIVLIGIGICIKEK